jgi:hypothetical protein
VLERRVLLVTSQLALLSAACAGAVPAARAAERPGLQPVAVKALTVTSGAVLPAEGGGLAIRSPTVRAVAEDRGRDDVEVAFVYRGPSHDAAPLASGELRRQIGLKLRAQDTCNVIYVMWHIAPTTGIHVAVKSNPGVNTQAGCGDGGYRTLAPTWSRPVASPIVPGERRSLRATLERDQLRVTADGESVWTGRLPPEALALEGPVGLRSDNGDFDLVLRASSERKDK